MEYPTEYTLVEFKIIKSTDKRLRRFKSPRLGFGLQHVHSPFQASTPLGW